MHDERLGDLLGRQIHVLQNELMSILIAQDIPKPVRGEDHEAIGAAARVQHAVRVGGEPTARAAPLEAMVAHGPRDRQYATHPPAQDASALPLHPLGLNRV